MEEFQETKSPKVSWCLQSSPSKLREEV
jgi:hypothetical protein